MEDKKNYYVTTPIYYPSGKFHIGTAYSTILADMMKRYKIGRGFNSYMLTGLDEHGQKIQRVAESKGLTPKEHVDEMAVQAKKLWKKLKIENDDFIRTTEERHEKVVKKIFDYMMEKKDIYLGSYEGWYCTSCETFFTETQLNDGKCPDCGKNVEKMKEESYFFDMKKYEKKLLKFYEENPNFLKPESRKNEILNNFIKPGLENLCVSRTSFDWGIKVPKNPKHVVYVWLDALTNYITALGYGSENDSLFKEFWPADLHIIGKDIIRFHAIYWPIFLMSLELPIPKQIYAHGWILMKDGKMSKSRGNVVYPELLMERYGVDATRYFLLKELSYDQDGLFTPEGFIERYNSDLCNDLGNLVNRTIGMVNKYFAGEVSEYNGFQNEQDEELEKFVKIQISNIEENIENLHISNSLGEIWKIVARTNKYIDETAPWILAKDDNAQEKLKSVIYHLVENIRKIAIMINPYMQDTSKSILEQIGITDEKLTTWDSIYKYDRLKDVKVVEKGIPLFNRLDKEEEIEYIINGMKK